MTTIVTRTAKGSALSWNEVDTNFTNLNTDKLEVSTAGSTYETQVHASSTYAPITTTVTKDSSVGAINTTNGTTAQRPVDAVAKIRYNSTLDAYEGYTTFYGWDSLTNGSTLKLGRSGVSTNNLIITSGTEPCVITNGAGTSIATLRPNLSEFAGDIGVKGLTTYLYPRIRGTSTATTSGSSVIFTGIPSWVTKVTLYIVGVSSSSTGNYQVQLGNNSAVFTTTGYNGAVTYAATTVSPVVAAISSGFNISNTSAAATILHGTFNLERHGGTDVWCATSMIASDTGSSMQYMSGNVTQTDFGQLKFLVSTGTFDAGSISITYE